MLSQQDLKQPNWYYRQFRITKNTQDRQKGYHVAMNMTFRGHSASVNHRVRPIYKDFRPLMESKEDQQAKTVHILLPGFLKEQVRILAESGRRVLRVRGESLVGGNKGICFSEEVTVPKNCEMAGITAKLEGEFLRISMPRKMATASQIGATVPEIPQLEPQSLEQEGGERGIVDERKRIGREIPGEEFGERKMLMNVGVAAVVIVALGSWISYSSIASSSASSII